MRELVTSIGHWRQRRRHGTYFQVQTSCANCKMHLPISRSVFSTRLISRSMASRLPSRPSPLPLPLNQQREFEALQRQAEDTANRRTDQVERHPDALVALKAEFIGDVNPVTGEYGGPKREPVQRWVEEEGDWSLKGRVSDF
ncbi:hypothetical protein EI94DRAFT_1720349 [Lactarius quietus]|nr:hypothetical protein EI94DRAFT_1720349 [Lactarius quietus]